MLRQVDESLLYVRTDAKDFIATKEGPQLPACGRHRRTWHAMPTLIAPREELTRVQAERCLPDHKGSRVEAAPL